MEDLKIEIKVLTDNFTYGNSTDIKGINWWGTGVDTLINEYFSCMNANEYLVYSRLLRLALKSGSLKFETKPAQLRSIINIRDMGEESFWSALQGLQDLEIINYERQTNEQKDIRTNETQNKRTNDIYQSKKDNSRTIYNTKFSDNPKIEEKASRKTYPYEDIIQFLNDKSNSSYKSSTKKTQGLIKARSLEGFTLNDFKKVISHKCDEWLLDPKMNTYLRPETLFGNKFESYVQSATKIESQGSDGPKDAFDLYAERIESEWDQVSEGNEITKLLSGANECLN